MKLKVIIIDDEDSIRETLKMYLEDQGHEVFTAPEPILCDVYNGHECNEDYPCGDIMLIDYKMPKMTGTDFLQSMESRGCKGLSATKILMSGDTGSIDKKIAKQLGCQIIQKPLTFQMLDELIFNFKERLDPERQLADLSAKLHKFKRSSNGSEDS